MLFIFGKMRGHLLPLIHMIAAGGVRIDFLEKEIAKLEKRLKEIETVLSAPGKDDDIIELTREYLEVKRSLDNKTEEWYEYS